jgi:hypothetical protein
MAAWRVDAVRLDPRFAGGCNVEAQFLSRWLMGK